METEAQRGKTLCLVTSTIRNEPRVLGFQLRADRGVYTGWVETHGLHPLQGQDASDPFLLCFPKALKAKICCTVPHIWNMLERGAGVKDEVKDIYRNR